MTIFIDCTYTRLQQGNVGITRVVRNLIRELQACPQQFGPAIPVCYGTKGFRIVDAPLPTPETPSFSEAEARSAGPAITVFRRLTSGNLRTRIVNTLPLLMQRILWRAYSTMTFAHLANDLTFAEISAGDVVLLPDAAWNYRVWECALAARANGAHIITLVHDLIPLNHPEFVAPLFSEVFRTWFLHMLDCSSALVCNSRATRDEVISYCSRHGYPPPPIGHFHLGVDASPPSPGHIIPIRPSIEQIVRNAEAGRPTFLAVGSIERRKRHDFLLDAFDRVWHHHPDATLVVAGRPGGEVVETLQRMTEHPQRGRQFFWYADATDGELDRLYQAASALVFCSAAEGFGLPLIEARSRGCRVIASDIPAFRELADDGVVLFPTDDPTALTQAICDQLGLKWRHLPSPGRSPLLWSESAEALVAAMNRLLPTDRH